MNKVNLFLDSGAYSAFSKGATIDIQEYIAFIKENLDIIEVYANLDVIGDAAATLDNQEIMEAAGLKPLPCFHYGEDIEYLEYYLSKYDYIALGGMVPISTQDLMPWLDDLFSKYICNEQGYPRVKVHGFGLTSLKLMIRYCWFSVDSTSWIMAGRNGVIPVPRFRNGKYDYLQDPYKVTVSDRSPSNKEAGKHITTFSPQERKIIVEYLNQKGYRLGSSEFRMEPTSYELQENEKWIGKPNTKGTRELELVTEPGVSNDYFQRDELNIIYYMDLEKVLPEWPWPFKLKHKSFGL